jgi:hypothetical protein
MKEGGISEHLDALDSNQLLGSHSASVDGMFAKIEAKEMYSRGSKLYHDTSFASKVAAYKIFDTLTEKYDSSSDPAILELVRKANVSKENLATRWLQ